MTSTWESRNQPVLETIVRTYDESGPGVSVEQIEAATGLPQHDVQRALRALMHEDPPFFTPCPLGVMPSHVGREDATTRFDVVDE